jgi:hypothetical protein
MIQCGQCEYFQRGPGSTVAFACDPFSTIKEPECLVKWQLIKLDTMVRAYEATVQMYKRMAPLQEKMLRQMEREIDATDEADSWKRDYDEDADEEDPDGPVEDDGDSRP